MSLIRRSCCAALLLVMGCQSYDRTPNLTLTNRSDRPVYYAVSCDSSIQDLELESKYLLKPNESARPYLLYGPEGNGENKNPWVNAINRADGKALHVFYYYIDFKQDKKAGDSIYPLIIQRFDYSAGHLDTLHWKLEYTANKL